MKKRRAPAQKKRRAVPKIKVVKVTKAVVLHVEGPPKTIPLIIPGPDPHVMRIVPLPAEKAHPQSWLDYFLGVEKK